MFLYPFYKLIRIRKLKRFAEGTLDPDTVKAYRKKVRQAQQELKAFVDANSDVLRRDYNRENVGAVQKTVAKSKNRDIIKESSKKTITKITDKAIKQVPKVDINGYTDEQCRFIHQQHKELLKYARDNNDNKEVAFVFDGELKNRKAFLGEDDRLDFGGELYGKDLFVMHNHPRNSSYSLNDIVEFFDESNVKSLTIVKNNGKVEVLTKVSDYDRMITLRKLDRMIRKNIKTGSDSEYRSIVNKFLNKYIELGVIEWLK